MIDTCMNQNIFVITMGKSYKVAISIQNQKLNNEILEYRILNHITFCIQMFIVHFCNEKVFVSI